MIWQSIAQQQCTRSCRTRSSTCVSAAGVFERAVDIQALCAQWIFIGLVGRQCCQLSCQLWLLCLCCKYYKGEATLCFALLDPKPYDRTTGKTRISTITRRSHTEARAPMLAIEEPYTGRKEARNCAHLHEHEHTLGQLWKYSTSM